MYFKAEVYSSFQLTTYDKKTNKYKLLDEIHENGLVDTFTAPTMSKLIAKIKKRVYNFDDNEDNANLEIHDGALEISHQGERHPDDSDRTPFLVTKKIIISKVKEEILDLALINEIKEITN